MCGSRHAQFDLASEHVLCAGRWLERSVRVNPSHSMSDPQPSCGGAGAAETEGRFESPPPRSRTSSLPPRAPKGRRGHGRVLAGDEVRIRNMAGEIVATIDASGELTSSSLFRTALLASDAKEEQSGHVRRILVDGSGLPLSIDDHVWTGEISVVAMQVGEPSDD